MELCSFPAIYLGPDYGGGNEDNGDLPQKIPSMHCYSLGPQPHAFAGGSWTHTIKSPVGSLFFSPLVLVYKVLLCLLRVYFPVLCKFWQIYSVVNGDLLQKGLCHTQVCCTQSPCPCGRPLLTRTSTDVQIQFCLSLCGVPGSWCVQGWLEPSECLWWEWGLILNVNLPLLPSCWGFSFALGCAVSTHVWSSEA